MEYYGMLSFLGLVFTSHCAGFVPHEIFPTQLKVNTRARKLTMT